MPKLTRYEQYTQVAYAGRTLLERHALSEYGVWQVYGEDPNCDMGGPHHQPDLGLYKGRLKDVIEIAVELKGFWQWGGGGDIRKVEVQEVETRKEQLRKELAALDKVS